MARESLALRHARAEAGSRQMFEDVPAVLHTQDQAAAPIGQELAHVNVCFESTLTFRAQDRNHSVSTPL